MAVIDGVLTDLGLELIAQHLTGDVSSFQLGSFKIGEGGFVESGGSEVPKVPDPAKTRLDADGNVLTGSITFTNGSPNVSGSGTNFDTEVVAGQFVRLDDDLEWVEVQSVTDASNLVLTGNYAGAGGTGTGSVIAVPYFVFQKAFTSEYLTYEEPGRMNAVAFLDFGDGNSGGYGGGNPKYFEIGLFDAASNLLIYGTYPGETKTGAIQFNKVVRVTFARVA